MEFQGFADVDGSVAEDCHAISGYTFIINKGAVSWSAKCQDIILLLTTESEYVAVTHATKEALWLHSLIQQLFNITLSPTTLFSDNQSAIALTRDHQYHACTKHIDIQYHFICWAIKNGSIHLIYCPTDDMVADCLTKALPSTKSNISLHNSDSHQLEGECWNPRQLCLMCGWWSVCDSYLLFDLPFEILTFDFMVPYLCLVSCDACSIAHSP